MKISVFNVWLLGAGLAACAIAADDDTMQRWVDTRKLISREKQDWSLGSEVLRDRIDLLSREREALREKQQKTEEDISQTDEKLAELNRNNQELVEATSGLEDRVSDLERRLLALLPRLPDPIRERVRPLSQRIPEEDARTELSLSERFQNVLGILNEMNKFSREIVVASEVRELKGGVSSEVSVLYLGMGQAYYCNLNGGVAGVGRPGDTGWEWEEHNDLVEAIDFAIGVYRTEKPAEYVILPVSVE